MRTRRVVSVVALVLLGLLFAVPAGKAQAFDHNPILFVHGIEGSGAQFESQKMRFISNGYPSNWFDEVDYNSTRAVADTTEVDQQIDAAIASSPAADRKGPGGRGRALARHNGHERLPDGCRPTARSGGRTSATT